MSEQVGVAEREVLDRVRTRIEALNADRFRLLADIAELDRLGVAGLTGDRSTEKLVADLGRTNPAEATRLVEEARDLTARAALSGEPLPPRYPHTAAALAAGAVSATHVAIVRRTMGRLERVEHLTPDILADAEHQLAQSARELPPRGLERAATRLVATLDPDGAAPDEHDRDTDQVQLLRRRDGSLDLRARIHDTADASLIDEGFDVLSRPAGPEDDRDLPRRRADALKELFATAHGPSGLITDTRRGDDAPADGADLGEPSSAAGSAARALLTITIDHGWLRRATGHGTLDGGTLTDVGTARRWACDAAVVPMVLGSSSQPLDVGRLTRTVPDAIRRALTLRDGSCAFPGCTRRPRRCHAHHVRHWADGGVTALHNLTLLCLHHHQLVHHEHWHVEMTDGRPWFTPPPWIDPQRRPRRGGRSPVTIPCVEYSA